MTKAKKFDAVDMKRQIQERIARETEGMSREEYWEYIRRGAEEFRRSRQQRLGGLKELFASLDRRDAAGRHQDAP